MDTEIEARNVDVGASKEDDALACQDVISTQRDLHIPCPDNIVNVGHDLDKLDWQPVMERCLSKGQGKEASNLGQQKACVKGKEESHEVLECNLKLSAETTRMHVCESEPIVSHRVSVTLAQDQLTASHPLDDVICGETKEERKEKLEQGKTPRAKRPATHGGSQCLIDETINKSTLTLQGEEPICKLARVALPIGNDELCLSKKVETRQDLGLNEAPVTETSIIDVAVQVPTCEMISDESAPHQSLLVPSEQEPLNQLTSETPMQIEDTYEEVNKMVASHHNENAGQTKLWFARDAQELGTHELDRFYLLVYPPPMALSVDILDRNGKSLGNKGFQRVVLPRESEVYMGPYTCWQVLLPKVSTAVRVSATLPESRAVKIYKALTSRTSNLNSRYFVKKESLQLDFLHVSSSVEKHTQHLAFYTMLVLLNDPPVVESCLRQYNHFISNSLLSPKDALLMLKKSLPWLKWIQQELTIRLTEDEWKKKWALKTTLALLSQIHILRCLQGASVVHDSFQRQWQVPFSNAYKEIAKQDLVKKHYEALLLLLSNILSIMGPLGKLSASIRSEFANAARDLVDFAPTVMWSCYLDALCNADPSYVFISKWTNKQMQRSYKELPSVSHYEAHADASSSEMAMSQAEKDYEEAFSRILTFSNGHPNKTFKDKALRAAILAAPSACIFFNSISFLSASNLALDAATVTEVEGFLSSDYGYRLTKLLEKFTELETPKKMSRLLLQALGNTKSESMLLVLRIFVSNFVRNQLKHATRGDSEEHIWIYLKDVFESPFTLLVPLLHTESIMMSLLLKHGPLELLVSVVIKLSDQVDSLPEHNEHRGMTTEIIAVWLQQICARSIKIVEQLHSQEPVPITPFKLYSLVTDVLGHGLKTGGYLADTLSEVLQFSLRHFCSTEMIIRDLVLISTLKPEAIVVRYHVFARNVFLDHLMSNDQITCLDSKAEQLLRWLLPMNHKTSKACISNERISMKCWVQEELCVTLMDALVEKGYSSFLSVEGLVDSKFLLLLLQIDGVSHKVKGHSLYLSASRCWACLQEQIRCGNVLVKVIDVLKDFDVSCEKICKEQNFEFHGFEDAIKSVTEYINIELNGFQMLLHYARHFENSRCSGELLKNLSSWLHERNQNCRNFTLNDIRENNHWPVKLSVEFLRKLLVLKNSKMLENIFKERESHTPIEYIGSTGILGSEDLSGREQQTLWASVASLLEASLVAYRQEWRSLSILDYQIERLHMFLDGVDQELIGHETDMAVAYFDIIQEPTEPCICSVASVLRSWMRFVEKQSLKIPLIKIKSKFNLVEDKGLILQTLLTLQTSSTVEDFLYVYENNKLVIEFFSSEEVEVLKQLAEADELIEFLKENSDEDLRMLADAVEEQAEDAVVDEATVSDLIHIEELLRPLLQSPQFTLVDLKATITQKSSGPALSPDLSGKLSICNANIHKIKRFVASPADRSSLLKSHILKIVESGIYKFVLRTQRTDSSGDVCKFNVSYGGYKESDPRQHFNLTELKDLRSRARMLLSTRIIKQNSHGYKIQNKNPKEGQRPNVMEASLEFVEHVSLAEKILEQLYDLHYSGHLLFDEVKWEIRGLKCLQERVQWMTSQISCWHTALEKARRLFNCLNYFKGIELRLMYHCFIFRASSEELQICLELLEWAKPGLDKETVEAMLKSYSFSKMQMDANEFNRTDCELCLENCLNNLGTAVDLIFDSINSKEQDMLPKLLLPATSTPSQARVRLLAVEDQQHELDLVVKLFHEHTGGDLGKMATNLLLCSPLTNWEDIHLLILRFLASDKKSEIFVAAYIDKLTFECQLQLTERLQKFSAANLQELTEHQLILVCCSKTQALHGVSHHINVPIQFMNGSGAESVSQILPESCKEIRVVTSDLSGMGKSRYITMQASDVCNTLPIDGEVTRDNLILGLKKMATSMKNSLHLDITSEKDNDNLNVLLFELLICRALRSSYAGVYRLPAIRVYVELANTLGNFLEASLFICSWLPQEHLKWCLDAWQISEGLDSDDQVVCVYLDKLATHELDKLDIVLSGNETNVVALPNSRCRELMQEFFLKDSTRMSYTILAGFIKTFAYQLRKFGDNPFCKCDTLRWILHDDSNAGEFRSMAVQSLLQTARDLSSRSVMPWLHEEQKHIATCDIEESMHERTSSMLSWSESNHVMIFFDTNGLMRILYRDHILIPLSIKRILSIQAEVLHTQLPDYSVLSSEELWQCLWPILCADATSFVPDYILTPDNFLKMAFVSLRIKTRVPVIIMGETGCGKTSLLRALASYSNAEFCCLTLHAGSTKQDIESFIRKAEAQVEASNKQVWAFLDEINACPYLGFLKSILCQHTISGRALHVRLVVLAACNPYRLRDKECESSGLQIINNDKLQSQKLAYTVHPLPESMLDHVWDYGTLNDKDERAYIAKMIGNRKSNMVDVISSSQMFMRWHFGRASVSLRDVQRWISLYDWFEGDIRTRLEIKGENKEPTLIETRAKVLACSLCYHCRLSGKDLRKQYREMCCPFLWPSATSTLAQATFLEILREEQMDILSRMEIPPGIAINSSLLENVFVILVCLLNIIPVFSVGKPGSGKTLALQMIYSNLRGTDSRDDYFRKLPRILSLSYQGSLNSTSEGIMKVFDRAKRYANSNKGRDILVVVVLDEIGLAESSCHNPLKVLHPLLEPDIKEIAFVGISNWSLDAAKMNRGIHLSQSDPDIDDLRQISLAIFESYKSTGGPFLVDILYRLAAVYHDYHAHQARADFHGLRDFYSSVKAICRGNILPSPNELAHALWRNFGGSLSQDIKILFAKCCGSTEAENFWSTPPSVIDLVKENLQDPDARHLMLITEGESASDILHHILQEDENFTVLRGSTYEDEKNEEYCYLMLSDIILHMETGRHMLLENADQIWTSLYDMLNQHYSFVGGRRNCRIALGPYCKQLCFVHDNFRCIVVVKEEQLASIDPPFLNRFEKQRLTYESILCEPQKQIVESIRGWAHELASIGCNASDLQSPEHHMFSGYYQDSIPSLVMLHSTQLYGRPDILSQPDEDILATHSQLIERCKIDMLQTAYVDAIARVHLSFKKFHVSSDMGKLKLWTDMFLSWKFLHSLKDLIEAELVNSAGWTDSIGTKLIVTTCSPLQWSIQKHMEGVAAPFNKYTFMRLRDFSSERQLQSKIQDFWYDEDSSLLIAQADDILDKDHISLAKFQMDKTRNTSREVAGEKHMVLIIHGQHVLKRQSNFSFLCGWKQLTLHQLQAEPITVRDYLDQSIRETIHHKDMPIKNIMAKVLMWSYLCIKYEDSNITPSYPQQMVHSICEDEALIVCITERALKWILSRVDDSWQYSVFNNHKLLSTSASINDVFVQYIEETFREPVARIIYLLEKTSSLKSYFTYNAEKKFIWRCIFMLPESLKLEVVPAPCYPEDYSIARPLELKFPFSSLYAAHVDNTFQELYLHQKEVAAFISKDNSLRHNSIQKDVDSSLSEMLSVIVKCTQWDAYHYIEDFAKIYAPRMIEGRGALRNNISNTDDSKMIGSKIADSQALEWVLRENLGSSIQHPSDIHILFWERELELKAQVSMALLCIPLQEIENILAALKAGRTPQKNFHEELSIRCSRALLPTKPCVDEAGGIRAWLHMSQSLTSLLPPGKMSVLLFMLESLHELAVLVIVPLKENRACKTLFHLADSFQKNLKDASFVSVLKAIVQCIPDINNIGPIEAKCWLDFLCAVLKEFPKLTDLPGNDLVQILGILMSSLTSSCMMGSIMLKLLKCYISTIQKAPENEGPLWMVLLSNSTDAFLNKHWDTKEPGSVLLSDQLYHCLRQTITADLLGGRHTDYMAFDRCLCVAINLCEGEVPITLHKILALAFWKSFLHSAACLLNQLKNGEVHDHSFRLVYTPAFTKALNSMSSTLKCASQTFFMKVLYRDIGLSIGDIQGLLPFCKIQKQATNMLVFLDHFLLRNTSNLLKFNPFTCPSEFFIAAELKLKQVLGNEYEYSFQNSHQVSPEKTSPDYLWKLLLEATYPQQIMFINVMASALFVEKSGASLSKLEWAALDSLKGTIRLANWDHFLQNAVIQFFTEDEGGIWHLNNSLSSNDLELRCLILDIMLKVAALPNESPLRGYCTLASSHFQGAYVLTDANNILQMVEGLGNYLEYVCPCGFQYIIGDCTRPAQTATCPNCCQLIGGTSHQLQPGQLPLKDTGSIVRQSVLGSHQFSLRISPKCYRLLRILVYSCLLISAVCCEDLSGLSAFMQRETGRWSLIQALKKSIEEDMAILGKLIGCQYTMTAKYVHSILELLCELPFEGPLRTIEARDNWESKFQKLVEERAVHEAIYEYLKRKGTDGLNNLLMEQGQCPPYLLQSYFRITIAPCLSDYEIRFSQCKQRAIEHPCIAAVLDHANELKSLMYLVPIVRFSGYLHQILGHNITRDSAAATSIETIMEGKSDLSDLYNEFERSWNSLRLEVKGYECRQFMVPEMHKDQPVAFCLLEKKDQGVFITAIFELLRTRQNNFLQQVEACTSVQPRRTEDESKTSVPVQQCKADQIIAFHDAWLDEIVGEVGMCGQTYGHGIDIEYDDSQIERQVFHKLVKRKPMLRGEYVEFPYQRESFQRHATLISDVRELVSSERLPSEKLASICRELTLEAVGAGQILTNLELCLGFLRKTNASPSEPLQDYFKRWLVNQSHPVFDTTIFDGVQVKHAVSLYEGLEESASSSVEDLVTPRYRVHLDGEVREDLKRWVMAKDLGCPTARVGSSSHKRLGAEAFVAVLRQFMFRYLTTDTFKPDDDLSLYLTNPQLVTWPEVDLCQDTLVDIFPKSFKLKHSRALYIALKEVIAYA